MSTNDTPAGVRPVRFVPGSFHAHLSSGSFVRAMCEAIKHADPVNVARLASAFPQMVAAWQLDDWDAAPAGFEPHYNAWPLATVQALRGEGETNG